MRYFSFSKLFGRSWRATKHGKRDAKSVSPRRTRLAVELLEERLAPSVVTSTLPQVTVSNQSSLADPASPHLANEFDPQVAYDPANPQKMFEVNSYLDQTTGYTSLTGAYSINAGNTWTSIALPFNIIDPAIDDPVIYGTKIYFTQAVHPSIAIGRDNQVYIVSDQSNATMTSGAIVLEKFDFSGLAPAQANLTGTTANQGTSFWTGDTQYGAFGSEGEEGVLYRWYTINPAYSPVIAIDNNLPTYTDPNTGKTVTDDLAGLVNNATFGAVPKTLLIAWSIYYTEPVNSVPALENDIVVDASPDGGNTFTGVTGLTDFYGAPDEGNTPAITFTQGNTGGVAGGQVTYVWSAPKLVNGVLVQGEDGLDEKLLTPGAGNISTVSYVGAGGYINDATKPTTTPPDNIPGETYFDKTVNLPASMGTISNIEVTVNIIYPNLDQLGLILIPPTGYTALLLRPHLWYYNGNAYNPSYGIAGGANLGTFKLATYVYTDAGLTFDAHAPLNITSTLVTAPIVGEYQPEYEPQNRGLGQYAGKSAASLSGTWKLEVIDNIYNNPIDPPYQFLDNWTLSFTGNQMAKITTAKNNQYGVPSSGNEYNIPYTGTYNNPPAPYHSAYSSVTNIYPQTGVGPYGAVGVGPGVSLAVDNSLGSGSQFAGRMYLAYTGMDNGDANALDTNIYLMYSDNGGQSWAYTAYTPTGEPAPLNTDSESDDSSEGDRAQFMPDVTVDPTTGTVVVTYYDDRNDASNTRPANTIEVSIDGGIDWSPINYLNQMQTATNFLTNQTVTFQPIPGNQNLMVAGAFGFGDEQGLIAYGGTIVPMFASNLNIAPSATVASPDINTAIVTVTAGPRIVYGDQGAVTTPFTTGLTPLTTSIDEMGGITYNVTTMTVASTVGFPAVPFIVEVDAELMEVTAVDGTVLTIVRGFDGSTAAAHTNGTTVYLKSNSGIYTYNSTTALDGTQRLDGFIVQFDRPINVATFLTGDVSVQYQNPNTGVVYSIPVGSILPLDENAGFGPDGVGTGATVALTGTVINGSTIVTGLSETYGLEAGMVVTGAGIPYDTTIASIYSAATTINQTGGIGVGDTSMTVTSSAGFPAAPFVVQVGNEQIDVTAVSGTMWTIVRGYNGTTAAAHADGAAVALLSTQVTLSNPVTTSTTTINQTGGILSTATTMTVTSSIDFPATPFVVEIGTEEIEVTNVTGNTWTIVRGYNGTTAAAWMDGATITLVASEALTFTTPGALATTFAIQLQNPQSAVGTYSYSIGAGIQDGVTIATTLTASMGASTAGTSQQISIANNIGIGISTPFVVRVGSENLLVTNTSYDSTGQSWTVTRGFGLAAGTAVPAHTTTAANPTVVTTFGNFMDQNANTLTGEGPSTSINMPTGNAGLGGITAASTTMVVASSAGFPATPFLIQIGDEQIDVTSISGTNWTITRGVNGTAAAVHTDFAPISLAPTTTVVTEPFGNEINGVGGIFPGDVDPNTNTEAIEVPALISGFPPTPFVIRIDGEDMEVINSDAGTDPNDGSLIWDVIRGFNGTTVASHANGAEIITINEPDQYAIPTPVDGVPFTAPYQSTTLPLIIPGPHVLTTSVPASATTTIFEIGGISAGQTTVTVASSLTFPTAPFVVQIDSELIDVTSVVGNIWTITRGFDGTSAASHANSATITYQNYTQAVTTTLPDAVGNSALDTTIVVASNTGYPNAAVTPFVVYIDGEQLQVTDDATTTWTVVRGYNNTNIEYHDIGAVVTYYPENLVLNTTNDAIDVTFDRNIAASSFTSADILSIIGPNGPIYPPPGGSFTVTADPPGTPAGLSERVFRIGIPSQTISGTYTIQFSPLGIEDTNTTNSIVNVLGASVTTNAVTTAGNGIDSTLTAGLDLLRGVASVSDTTVTTNTYSNVAPVTIPANGSISSTISIADAYEILQATTQTQFDGQTTTINEVGGIGANDTLINVSSNFGFPNTASNGPFIVQIGTEEIEVTNDTSLTWSVVRGYNGTTSVAHPDGATITEGLSDTIQLELNILYNNVPNLSATLTSPDGTIITLFTNVGTKGATPHANFANTVFDDSSANPIETAQTPIQVGPFDPQEPLSQLNGTGSQGTWTLTITNNGNQTGTLTEWELRLPHGNASSGLGQPNSDQFNASFRIFTQNAENAQSSTQWTAVGPIGTSTGPVTGGDAGSVTALAVDAADPSGNTVYVGGASGGIWKTTDYLTTNPDGPTWVPLTVLGPTASLYIGSIALFDVNKNPQDTVIIAGTGDGPKTFVDNGSDQNSPAGASGIGFLRSDDGGQTWQVLDSTTNVDASDNILPMNSAGRDHLFDGSYVNQVVVDPTALPGGGIAVYAAVSGPNGGLYRSIDGGNTWTLVRTGQATSVQLASASQGDNNNLTVLYAGFAKDGIYITIGPAVTATAMSELTGGLISTPRLDIDNLNNEIPVTAPSLSPDGYVGNIVLSVPAMTNDPLEDTFYQGWLYAAVTNPEGSFEGLFVTKDYGDNWTLISLPVYTDPTTGLQYPTNDFTQPSDDVSVNGQAQNIGNYALALAVDPTDPSVVYLGSTDKINPNVNPGNSLLRIDTSTLSDPYTLLAYNNDGATTGSEVQFATTGPTSVKPNNGAMDGPGKPYGILDPYSPVYPLDTPQSPYTDLYREPSDPFVSPSSLQYRNVASFNNQGTGAFYQPFVTELGGGTNIHVIVADTDPLSGGTRLYIGDDQGTFTGVDTGDGGDGLSGVGENPGGVLFTYEGSDQIIEGARNGDLQIAQLYDGASQPSTLAAAVAGALFYAPSNDNGYYQSTPDILTTGNLVWSAPDTPGVLDYSADGSVNGTSSADGLITNGAGVQVDQSGSGQLYQFVYPSNLGSPLAQTDFLLVTPAGQSAATRVSGLIQVGDIPGENFGEWGDFAGAFFAVNPYDNTAMVMGSQDGFIFLTAGAHTGGTGITWKEIASPGNLDGFEADALAFGAPTTTTGQLDNFIYAGTQGGDVFVTYAGGGYNGSTNWRNISAGLDGSPIEQIVPDTKPGSSDAYAVTTTGVFYMPNASASNPNPAWIPISDLTGQTTTINQLGGITGAATTITVASSAGFPAAPFVVMIGAEQLDVTNVAGNTWTVIRGYNGTQPTGAANGALITLQTNQLFGLSRPMFNSLPVTTITQAGGIGSADTTMTVASNAGFPTATPFVVTIGAEQVDVTAVVGDIWTIVRGYNGTTPAAHANGATITGQINEIQTLDALTSIQADWNYAIPDVPVAAISQTGGITANATSFNVSSSTDFPPVPFQVEVGSEEMQVNNIVGTTWTVVRGVNGTTAAAAANGAVIQLITTINQVNGIGAAAASMNVTSSAGFPATPFVIQIDSEQIEVTRIVGTTWTISRGYNNTTAAAHADFATITMYSTHPVLYVGGVGGVFRSLDQGLTWTVFPDTGSDESSQQGGFLPDANVTSLNLELGNFNPATGFYNQSTGFNMLVATTYGLGAYAIRLNNNTMLTEPIDSFNVAPDAGPVVKTITPISTNNNTVLTGVTVTFVSAVDPSTFLPSEITVTDPDGNVVPIGSVVDISGTNLHNVYQVTFSVPDTIAGNYQITIGPAVYDFAGNPMNPPYSGIMVWNPYLAPTIVLNFPTPQIMLNSASDGVNTTINQASGITAAATTMTVASNTGFPNTATSGPFVVVVDSEYIEVTNDTTTTWTIVRGFEGTTAAAHANLATITEFLPFTIGDAQTPATSLVVVDSVAPVGGATGSLTLSLSGAGADRGISILSSATAYGQFIVTISVTDGVGLTTKQTFIVDVDSKFSIVTTSLSNWDVNFANYSQTIVVSGGTAPDTFIVASGTLPPGLTLNANTGAITGTPTATGTFNFSIAATDSLNYTSTQAYTVVINPDPLITGPATLYNWSQGVSGYDQVVKAAGGTPALTFSVTSGALPANLVLNAATGAITGTPIAALGTYDFTITVTDSVGDTYNMAYAITIKSPLAINQQSLPNWDEGFAYSQTLTATDSATAGPFSWVVLMGNLPTGLHLNAATGAITGTPSAVGTYNFTIEATDNLGNFDTQAFTIVINAPLAITPTTLPDWDVGLAGYDTVVTGTGGTGTLILALQAGSLPSGLTFNPATGAITGTPAGAVGISNFTISVTDSIGNTFSQAYAVTINAVPTITTTSLSDWDLDAPNYDQTVSVSGGTPSITWAVENGFSLPPGLGLNSTDGVISGTPSATETPGTTTISQTGGITAAATTMTVASNLLFPNTALSGPFYVEIDSELMKVTNDTTTTWTIVRGFNGSTPAAHANGAAITQISFIITATDSLGESASEPYSVTIYPALSITPTSLVNWDIGLSGYTQTITSIGGDKPRTLSLVGSLPQGLAFNAGTGVISGDPTATGTATFDIVVTDSLGLTYTQPYSITINPQPSITPATLPGWDLNFAGYSQTLTGTGGTGALTLTLQVGNTLPPGLIFNQFTGKIIGTPTSAGSYTFNMIVTDSLGQSTTQSYTIVIGKTPTISPTTLPNWDRNLAGYSQTLTASGGSGTLTLSLQSGNSLPPGLTFTPSTGLISGEPTTTGSFSFNIVVTDSLGATSTQPYTVVINADPVIATTSLANWDLNKAGYNQTIMTVGGTGAITFALQTGSSLPAGLTLNANTGVITGTPTLAGNTSFSIVATDSLGLSYTQPYTITINPALQIVTTSLSDWSAGVSGYSQTVQTSGGTGSITFSLKPGTSLPVGLALTANTGLISGTPTVVGSTTFTIVATDSIGETTSQSYTVVINSGLTITTLSLANWDQGLSGYNQMIQVIGGTGAATFRVLAGTQLPPGLVLSSAGAITGTPTTIGFYNVTIVATDSVNDTATQTYSITINPPLVITTTSLDNWTVNASGYSQLVGISGGTAPLTFSVQSGGLLPTGLSLNSSNGLITGTPTAIGTYAFTIIVEDGANVVVSQAYSVAIEGPLTVTGVVFNATSPQTFSGLVATAFDAGSSKLIQAANLVATIRWDDGTVNTGTVVATGNGNFNILGTHAYQTAGNYSVTVTLSDKTNPSATVSETTGVYVVHHSAYVYDAYIYAYTAYIYAYDAYVDGTGSYNAYSDAYDSFYFAYYAYYYDSIGDGAASEYSAYYAYYYGYFASYYAYIDWAQSGGTSANSYDAYVDAFYAYTYSGYVNQGF